jgi:hypothetical protein
MRATKATTAPTQGTGSMIGYRSWQNMTGNGLPPVSIFYGVALFNGSYAQASVFSNKCDYFSENVNCTGWASSEGGRFSNTCDVVRVYPHTDPPITGSMRIVVTPRKDPSLLGSMIGLVTIAGETMTFTLKPTEFLNGASFPVTPCWF